MTPASRIRRRTHLLRALATTAVAVTSSLVASPFLAHPAAAATAAPRPSAAAPKAATASFPTSPPAQICGNSALLNGPASPPAGAVIVAAGDNSAVNWNLPGSTFWFAPGTHTLGQGQYNQIVPANNSTFLGAPGAIVDGQGLNQYAFTQSATGVKLRYLTVQNFVSPRDQGVVNHDSGVNWVIQYNTILNNSGAAVMVGSNDLVSYNCLKLNGQYGFNAAKAGGDFNIVVDHNEITANNTANWDIVDPTCGCAGGAKIWNTVGGQITNNWVHNNAGPGLWADTNNAGILIDGNYIADNADEAIIYELSYNGQITNNNLLRNTIVKGKAFQARGDNFPIGPIYISESGGDARVDGGLYSTFNIAGNNLVDNWGGVVLWENADRFCGSPANTSATFCTAVNPSANLSTCVQGNINKAPYLSDCRWKTQNVSVHDNAMTFSRANVGCTGNGCGLQAIVSNIGVSPFWSPYLGTVVMTNITTNQNNNFTNNTYTGDWQFLDGGTALLDWSSWHGNMYGQDAGSSFNGVNAAPSTNVLDSDTSTLEGSLGHWKPWFSSIVAQSTAYAQTGTHSLQISVAAPFGWGVELNNFPGFAARAGQSTISFWAMSPAPGINSTLTVTWRDGAGTALGTGAASIANLTTTWSQATADLTAPTGTLFATVTLNGTTGAVGNTIYIDQVVVGIGSGSTPPPPPPPAQTNVLDADTATLEASVGRWAPWVSSSVAQSTAQAHGGTHSLQIGITAPNGWGVQVSNWPGFTVSPGSQIISFWGLVGSGTLGTTMQAQWRDGGGNVLGTTSATIGSLTSTWQSATANGTAPPGTVAVTVTFMSVNGAGLAGNSIYLDDIAVGPAASSGPPPSPPPSSNLNLVDSDTATIEGSVGHWSPWFSDTIAQTTAQALSGTHSLQVNVSALYGWGVQLNNSPGFAATPGAKNVSFGAMATTPGLNVTMQVTWRDAGGNLLATTNATLPSLTGTWQTGSAPATAPAGTAFAFVTFNGTNASPGNTVYLDQIFVGS